MKDRTVIFDIDGTLSDATHRQPLAQTRQWDAFHEKCLEDPVIAPIADLMRWMAVRCTTILLTGRNERFRHLTVQWLEQAGLAGMYDKLLMRPDNDFSVDHDMKIAAIEKHFKSKDAALETVWFVVEDRDSVVEALRNYGFTVLQPCTGSY